MRGAIISICSGLLVRSSSAFEISWSHCCICSAVGTVDRSSKYSWLSNSLLSARLYLFMMVRAIVEPVRTQNPWNNTYSLIETVFFQLLSFMWSSRTSDRWAREAVRMLGEMLFKVLQSVSRISPSTMPAPFMKLDANRKKQVSLWPWTWNMPIAFSNSIGGREIYFLPSKKRFGICL